MTNIASYEQQYRLARTGITGVLGDCCGTTGDFSFSDCVQTSAPALQSTPTTGTDLFSFWVNEREGKARLLKAQHLRDNMAVVSIIRCLPFARHPASTLMFEVPPRDYLRRKALLVISQPFTPRGCRLPALRFAVDAMRSLGSGLRCGAVSTSFQDPGHSARAERQQRTFEFVRKS